MLPVAPITTRGRHLLVEYTGCLSAVLADRDTIERLMLEAARAAGATVLTFTFFPFAPQGVSGVVVIAESHLSIHTWPEHAYAAVDFFTCGAADPRLAEAVLRVGLGAGSAQLLEIERGRLDHPAAMGCVGGCGPPDRPPR